MKKLLVIGNSYYGKQLKQLDCNFWLFVEHNEHEEHEALLHDIQNLILIITPQSNKTFNSAKRFV